MQPPGNPEAEPKHQAVSPRRFTETDGSQPDAPLIPSALLQIQACVLDCMAEGVVVCDQHGYVCYTNPAQEQMFGYTHQEFLGLHVDTLTAYTPDEQARATERMMEGLKHAGCWEGEWLNRKKDGSIFHTLGRISTIEVCGKMFYICVQQDITARKLAEKAQNEVERQLTLLLEASSTLLAAPGSASVTHRILDLAKRFVGADAYSIWRKRRNSPIWEIAAMEGLSADYPRTVEERPGGLDLPPEPVVIEDVEQAPLVRGRLAIYKAEGIRSQITVPLRILDTLAGTLVFYYRSPRRFSELDVRVASALGNLAGAALGTAELYDREAELLALAQAEQARATFLADASRTLASSLDYEATLAAVAELAVPAFADWAAVAVLDSSGEHRSVALKHSDPAKIALAMEFRRRYPPTGSEQYRQKLRAGEPVLFEHLSETILRQSARDAEHMRMIQDLGIASVIMAPLMSNEGYLGVITFCRSNPAGAYTPSDLALAEELARRAAIAIENANVYTESQRTQTALSRANSDLLRANQDLHQFAYSASHDLQEPLRMIAVCTQVIERKLEKELDAGLRGYFDLIIGGARRMQALLEDLLAYTQAASIEADGISAIPAGPVLKRAIENLSMAIEESGANLSVTALPDLRIREAHLLQVFQNLLSNAIKYRGTARPSIEVGSERHGPDWEIRVADNGIGIAPRYHDQIFGVFKRLHTSDEYPGTGIGLAICKRIVERYGGRLWVESEEGRGSTFRFTLPGAGS